MKQARLMCEAMKARFDELLPFYANGTLGEVERRWVESCLGQHPQLDADLQWIRGLIDDVRRDAHDVVPEARWERVMARIRAGRARCG